MSETKPKIERTNFSAMIRQMLHDGKSFEEIEKELGVSRHLIYNVRYYATKKAKRKGVRMNPKTGKLMREYIPRKPKEEAAQTPPVEIKEEPISEPTPEPIPEPTPEPKQDPVARIRRVLVPQTYVAGLESQCDALKEKNRALKAEIRRMETQCSDLQQLVEIHRNKPPVQIEVAVPQPWSHYTFWQRLRIVFFGEMV